MIITQTPLRISFVGGGTDLPDYFRHNGGGAVISTAIDKYFFVIVKKRFDEMIRVGYSKTEIVDSPESLRHDLVREALKKVGVSQGVEISTMSDIPSEGTGLGSSSSVTVGLLNAIYCYAGKYQPAEVLARQACEIEVGILSRPIGKQDQYIAAYGGLKELRFNEDDTVTVRDICLKEDVLGRLNRNLMLFYTNVTRSASDILAEQKNNINNTGEILGKMKGLVDELKGALKEKALDDFGRLLHRGWEYKKQLADKISNPYIDDLYARALEAGALGGKITGAGGGGFLLLYCPAEKQDKVRQALGHLRELNFSFERDGSKVIFNVRR